MTRARKVLVGCLIVGTTAAITGGATWSAFSSATTNGGNVFQAGTVAISHESGAGALLSLSNATPGTTTTGCVIVRYTASLPSTVRTFATTTGSLDDYLTLKVTRGTLPTGTPPGCTGFSADSRDYVGQGSGVVYSGNLSAFPASYAAASDDPNAGTGAAESWTNGEAHAYKLEVTLQNNAAAQGQSATASFTWEARNQ